MYVLSPNLAGGAPGYGLHFAANGNGRKALVDGILACDRDLELLAGSGYLYVVGYIRSCLYLLLLIKLT